MGIEGGLTKQLALRVTQRDEERVERLARRIQIASTAAVMRAALRVGLDALERDPSLIFEPQQIGKPEQCIAELLTGERCGKPAMHTDVDRLGPVCTKHLEERPPAGQRVRRLKRTRGGRQ